MENYKPNSNKFKEEQAASAKPEERPKIEKVISGTVKTRKKSGLSKFKDEVVSDKLPTIKTYIFKDIIIPTIQKAITSTVDMLVYGSSRHRDRINGSKVSYRSYSSYSDDRPRVDVPRNPVSYNYDDIIFDSRGEAEHVLTQMNDIIDMYQMVSVADLYDMVGVSGNYTDNKYGWTNLRNAEVQRVSDGYILRLPKALPIK